MRNRKLCIQSVEFLKYGRVSITNMYCRYTPLRNVSISQYYSDNFKRTYVYINLFPMFIPYYTFILPSSQFKTFFVYLLLQVLYKHKIVLFGGFYDTLREVRSVELICMELSFLMWWCDCLINIYFWILFEREWEIPENYELWILTVDNPQSDRK